MNNHFPSFELAQMVHEEHLRRAAACRLLRQEQSKRSNAVTMLHIRLVTTVVMIAEKLQCQLRLQPLP